MDNSLDRGHTQVAILPTGYNCASDTSALSKSDYIAWGSNGALRCVSGTCTQSMTSFRFNNSVAGTYSVATELIVPPGDQLRILSCKDGVVLSEGSTITVDSNWTPNNP